MKKSTLFLLTSVVILSGCGQAPSQTTTSTPTTNDPTTSVVTISNLKEALSYLSASQNYTFTMYNGETYLKTLTFTEKSISTSIDGHYEDFDAFYYDGIGVFKINYFNDSFLPGEYLYNKETDLIITSVWDEEITSTLYNKSQDYINTLDTSNEVTIDNKNYKMTLLTSFGYELTDYVRLEYIKASYKDEILTFEFKFLSKTSIFFKGTNFGSTVDPIINSFELEGHKAFTPSSDLIIMRDFLRSNNFIREIYSFDSNDYIGYELFNPNYFVTDSNMGYLSGYMALNQKANEEHPDVDLYGCYMFSGSGSIFTDIKDPTIVPNPIYNKPNIVEMFHYPTYLKILDSLQYAIVDSLPQSTYQAQGNTYVITEQNYVIDFAKNMSIDQSFDLNEYVPYAVGIDFIETTTDIEITFLYYFRSGSLSYCMPIPLTHFGNANVKTLDKIWETFND